MASSKPQGYYICPLKALRESSSQSSEEEWIKVTRPICFRPGHKYFWGTVRLFLCPVSSALTDATRAAVHNSQCLWLQNKGTDKWASRTRLEEWTRKKDSALQYKPGTKSNIGGIFDQWPRLRANGFHIICTLFIIGWVSFHSLTPPLSFPVEDWWSIWKLPSLCPSVSLIQVPISLVA